MTRKKHSESAEKLAVPSGSVENEPPGRRRKGFVISDPGVRGELHCFDLRGFVHLAAALDVGVGVRGRRLVVVGANVALSDWLAAWSEDSKPRRSFVVTRKVDGRTLHATAELLVYGQEIDVVLGVNSAAKA